MKPLSRSTLESLERVTAEAERGLDSVLGYLEGRGIDRDTAINHRLGLVTDPSSSHYGMLCIPSLGINIEDEQEVWGVKYRKLSEGEPKYLASEGYESRLFNPRALLRLDVDALHVTEGELDCVILTRLGYAAVGVPGATQWKGNADVWSLMMEGFPAVYVWGDNDRAGEDFAKAVVHSMSNARRVTFSAMPEKADVTDAYLLGGAELIEEMVKSA